MTTQSQFNRQRTWPRGSRARSDFTSLVGCLPPCLVPGLVLLMAHRGGWPRWIGMTTLAAGMLLGFKWLTYWNWKRRGKTASLRRQLGYLLLWPGLNPDEFFDEGLSVVRPTTAEWAAALGKTACGAVLVFVALPLIPRQQWFLAGWTALVGLGFVAHFGLFHLLSLAWRRAGVQARAIMQFPPAAGSLSEFWGKRWNRAFSDLARQTIFAPLARRWGGRAAMTGVFFASAVLHELTISFPAGGGYGGPAAYFAIQAAGLVGEAVSFGNRPTGPRAIARRVLTWFWIVAPVGLLFHEPFLRECVLPLVDALQQGGGALFSST